MSGTLFVVATPIGNLEDITLRALRVLGEVHAIAAEDTRRTARLLARHAISTPMVSFHEHNTRSRIPQLMARLQKGENLALVSDAGSPGISDPGLELVQACIAEGVAVDPIPGANAPLTAAVVSGFSLEPLTICGFPPNRSLTRKRWLSELSAVPHTLTFFEAPHRIRQTLLDAANIFGERPIMIGRELTKAHQEFIRGTCSQVAQRLTEPRGEYTVVVGPIEITQDYSKEPPADERISDEFRRITNNSGVTRREAIKSLASKHRLPAKDIYAAIERVKTAGK